MSIVTTVRDHLLGLAGYEDPTHAPQSILARILSDINAVGERLLTQTPTDWWSIDDGAALLKAPVSISGLTLNNGDAGIAGPGLETWMHGCSVQLTDEPHFNEIRWLGGTSFGLRIPFYGSNTTNGAGTVYNDSINLLRSNISVNPPVEIPQRWALSPMMDISMLRQVAYRAHFSINNSTNYPYLWRNLQVATPINYLVEQSPQPGGEALTRIRVYPLPDSPYPMTWKQQVTFTKVFSFTDTRALLCPHAYHDSVFMPLLYRKFASHPEFKGDKQFILDDAGRAEATLTRLAQKVLKPTIMQVTSGM